MAQRPEPIDTVLIVDDEESVRRTFRDWLVEHGVNATVRANRGTDIDAACGQLVARERRRREQGECRERPAPKTAQQVPH